MVLLFEKLEILALLPNRKEIWERFENIFTTVDRLYKYRPTYCAYHKRMLEELCEDNIIYAEIRASLSPVSSNRGLYLRL